MDFVVTEMALPHQPGSLAKGGEGFGQKGLTLMNEAKDSFDGSWRVRDVAVLFTHWLHSMIFVLQRLPPNKALMGWLGIWIHNPMRLPMLIRDMAWLWVFMKCISATRMANI